MQDGERKCVAVAWGGTKAIKDGAMRRGLKVKYLERRYALLTENNRHVVDGNIAELRALFRGQPTLRRPGTGGLSDEAFRELRDKAARHGMRLKRRVAGSTRVYELFINGEPVLQSARQDELLDFIRALRWPGLKR